MKQKVTLHGEMDGRRSALKYTFRKLLLVLSMIGFSYQVIQVSRQYFDYKTTIRTEFVSQKQLTKHDIALCIRYNDILDLDRLKKETGIEVLRLTGNESLALAIAMEKLLTVKQIFDYTPNGRDLIEGCIYRPDDWDMRLGSADDCNKLFRVRRFVTQERMCYQVTDTNEFPLNRDAVSLSTFSPLTVYMVFFGHRLRQANMVSVIAFTGNLPLVSRQYSSPAEYFFAEKLVRVSNCISATPSDIQIISLERPYDTGCVNVQEAAQYLCDFECLVKSMSRYNRLPAWHLVYEDLDSGDRKLNSLTDSRNATMQKWLINILDACYNDCFTHTPCDLSYTRTQASVSKLGIRSLLLQSLVPPDPDIVVTANARMSFIDFFTFMSSCFGTWFGVSFLSLDRFWRHGDRKKVSAGNGEPREIILEYASFGRAREVSANNNQSRRRPLRIFMTRN